MSDDSKKPQFAPMMAVLSSAGPAEKVRGIYTPEEMKRRSLKSLAESLNEASEAKIGHTIPLMHIYAQEYCHVEAYITGNLSALRDLRDALTKVIETSEPAKATAFAADGEGYNVLIVPVSGDNVFSNCVLPYTDREFMGRDPQAVHPYDLLSKNDYIALMRPE